MITFSTEQVKSIMEMVLATECGYCMDGADLDVAICPVCGTDNLLPEGQRPA